ncbi:hypothetical protein MY4824_008510 [Beauveria thailandica]
MEKLKAKLKALLRYVSNLEWTERVQHYCKFCHHDNFDSIVYEDDEVIAVDNVRRAGQHHWLIMPKQHAARDIENLNSRHLGLVMWLFKYPPWLSLMWKSDTRVLQEIRRQM